MHETLLPYVACAACGAQGKVFRLERSEWEEVRGFRVEVVKTLRRCLLCNQEFENSRDPDWRVNAYEQFRAEKGWITPEQIAIWRKKYDLSQDEAERVLEWAKGTLGRYEHGALQTENHNAQMAKIMSDGGVVPALPERPEVPVGDGGSHS